MSVVPKQSEETAGKKTRAITCVTPEQYFFGLPPNIRASSASERRALRSAGRGLRSGEVPIRALVCSDVSVTARLRGGIGVRFRADVRAASGCVEPEPEQITALRTLHRRGRRVHVPRHRALGLADGHREAPRIRRWLPMGASAPERTTHPSPPRAIAKRRLRRLERQHPRHFRETARVPRPSLTPRPYPARRRTRR